jgi:hypothetical protein
MSWTLKIVNGDMVRKFSNNGYDSVTDLDKLKQECKMVLTTGIRTSGVGAGLNQAVGRTTSGEPSPVGTTPMMFYFQLLVRDALDRYRYVQRNFQYSRRSIKEMLDDFSPVQVWGDITDPRVFRWRVDFFSVGNLPNFAMGGTTR